MFSALHRGPFWVVETGRSDQFEWEGPPPLSPTAHHQCCRSSPSEVQHPRVDADVSTATTDMREINSKVVDISISCMHFFKFSMSHMCPKRTAETDGNDSAVR